MPEKFDIVVIGAGSAGLVMAGGAAQLGLKVALIEADQMGGDCLNYGCVPSKALLAAAKAAHAGRAAAKFGVQFASPNIDFAAVKDHVARVIAAIAPNDSQERFEGFGCTVLRERAQFLAGGTVQVGDRLLSARHTVIATGSHAAVPPIPGLSDVPYFTNETIFALRERPAHLVIIGGGPIGCEMAQAHVRLGVRVTLLEAGPTILAKDDPDHVAVVRDALRSEGVDVREQVAIASVRATADGLALDIGAAEPLMASHILVAAGRVPNVAALNLEAVGVAHTPRGITVDAALRTTARGIYAIGDCRAGPQFTHAAGYEATVLVRRLCFRLPAKVNYKALPWVTFTDPELAQVGLTEAAARAKFRKVRVLHWPFTENDRAQADARTAGGLKIITRGGRILGASMVGAQAGELIQPWALAISAGLTVAQMASPITAYPTLGEINKRAAGSAFSARLFSPPVRRLVGWLQKLPF